MECRCTWRQNVSELYIENVFAFHSQFLSRVSSDRKYILEMPPTVFINSECEKSDSMDCTHEFSSSSQDSNENESTGER